MLLKKNQAVSRFVLSDTDAFEGEGWRDRLRAKLEEMHFVDDGPVEERRSGFVDPWHLGTVTFEDHGRWIFEPYLVFGYRIDRRTVPSNLFNATVQAKIAAWCAEHDVERAPAQIRVEIKEDLRKEWIKRVLPKVKHLQLSIDVRDGSSHLFGSVSESDCDQVRRSVFRLLGARLVPWEQVSFRDPNTPRDPDSMMPQLVRAASMGPVRSNGQVPATERS